MLQALAGGGMSTSTSDQMSSTSGLTQTLGGINHGLGASKDNSLLIVAAVCVLALLIVTRKK